MNISRMNLMQIWSRIHGRYQRAVSGLFFRRLMTMRNMVPFISFTFDDFPRSALHIGGEILMRHGLRGTYYASLGLMGTEAPTGTIFTLDDIREILIEGHELGCHTYNHCHSWDTSPIVFEDSIIKNKRVLDKLVPGAAFSSFAYPIICPRPASKRLAGRYFSCCRRGGQTFNVGSVDLNILKAYFLEKGRNNPSLVKELIDRNCQARGWLIFATHDISETPTPYGCKPSFFEDIVKYSLASGARILPVAKAFEVIHTDSSKKQQYVIK